LAAPAKPGSYTAWKYGSPDGLSAGFHLFQYPSLDVAVEMLRNRSASCKWALNDATQQIREEYADRVRVLDVEDMLVDNMHVDPVLRDAFERRLAALSMERCPMPMLEPVSHTEPLKVHFSNPPPARSFGDLNQAVSPP
jgi:hypothetical protein